MRSYQTQFALAVLTFCLGLSMGHAQTAAPVERRVGAVQSITGDVLVIKTDAGTEESITVPAQARIVRLEPGNMSLQGASSMALSDLAPGDRVLVRSTNDPSNAGAAPAMSIVVMKRSDVASRQDKESEAWRTQGGGGIVSAVDPAAGTVAIKSSPNSSTIVRTDSATRFLRYAPDSVKFADAKASSLAEVHSGDQLRAKGTKNADGTEIRADAVVFGSFRNIAGTVSAVDADHRTVTVKDVLSKSAVTVQLASESQLRQLPPQVAQRMARMLQGGQPSAGPGETRAGDRPNPRRGDDANRNTGSGMEGRPRTPDLQQMIQRLPAADATGFHKDDAVMLVTTPGGDGRNMTVIVMIGGVEPVLTASPSGAGAASLLATWNLSAPAAEGGVF